MTNYVLLSAVTAQQSAPGNATVDTNGVALPAGSNLPLGSQAAIFVGGASAPIAGAVNQTFQLNVAGTGTVSATVQILGSNDGVLWSNYGSPFSASGTNVATAMASGLTMFTCYGAYITAISGTGAVAKVIMSA